MLTTSEFKKFTRNRPIFAPNYDCMQLLAFWLLYPLLWCISVLPFPLLYALSDLTYFFVYRVFGYRKKAVRKNLDIALPHLSVAERRVVERKFYAHMCDMFLEMIKTLTISTKEMNRRFRYTNIELLHEYEKTGRSLILMCAHYASWEWLIVMAEHIHVYRTVAIYKRIANRRFDKLVRDIRARLNTELIEAQKAIEVLHQQKEEGILAVYGFLGDQSPQLTKARHWDTFMGQEVPIHTGGEMLAKKLNHNIAYCRVTKKKRGYYEATIIPLAENPREYRDYEITAKYLKEVEKQIMEAPEFYFWTHKRWKHTGKKKKPVMQETTV